MRVGTVRLTIYIGDSRSLKDKRRVVKSLKDRLKNNFNLSVAEVDGHDNLKKAILGVAAVSKDSQYLKGVLAQVVNYVKRDVRLTLVDYQMEVF